MGLEIRDLVGPEREDAIPAILDSFVGIYRWHAKRTLRRIAIVRGAFETGQIRGISMLEDLVPGVGYVYYVAVRTADRRRGVGGTLLDDALDRFRRSRTEIVYAAAEEDNIASRRLFETRGFRVVGRDEPPWRQGGLGAWGLRSKMMVVSGEVLMGLRLNPPGTSITLVPARAGPL